MEEDARDKNLDESQAPRAASRDRRVASAMADFETLYSQLLVFIDTDENYSG